MRLKNILLLVAALLTAASLLAAEPNFLPGGSFDDPNAIKAWNTSFGVRTASVNDQVSGWIGIDALGNPNSGSMSLTGVGHIGQCIPITAGTAYDFGARIMINSRDHLQTPVASMKLAFFAGGQCEDTASLAEVATDRSAAAPGRFTAVAAKAARAPDGAHSAVISIELAFPGNGIDLTPGARRPGAFVDDVFVRETGQPVCVPDDQTLCFAGGKVRAAMTLFDTPAPATAVVVRAQQTSATTGYFFTDSPDSPQVTIKTYDFSPFGGPKWIVVGGMTNAHLQITVEDLSHDDVRTYTNADGNYFETIVDAFLNP